MDHIAACNPDLAVEMLEKIDDDFCAFGMAGQKLSFALYLLREAVNFRKRRTIGLICEKIFERAGFGSVVAIVVVVQNDAARYLVNRYALDAWDHAKRLTDFAQELWFPFAEGHLHPDASGRLMGDLELEFRRLFFLRLSLIFRGSRSMSVAVAVLSEMRNR